MGLHLAKNTKVPKISYKSRETNELLAQFIVLNSNLKL